MGLKPSKLAQLADCRNKLKNGNRVRQFELTGNISRELFRKIVVVLKVDEDAVEKLVEQDRREFFEKWLKWVNEPIRPYLVIRVMGGIYNECSVPSEINTMAEAEEWASAFARRVNKRCCLVWNRRISCWFNYDGTLERYTEASPGEPNVPWMKIGGRTFTFGADLSSVSQVDWPKKPSGPQRSIS